MQTGNAEAQAAQSGQRGQGRAGSSRDEDACVECQTLLQSGQHSSDSCTVIMAHLG